MIKLQGEQEQQLPYISVKNGTPYFCFKPQDGYFHGFDNDKSELFDGFLFVNMQTGEVDSFSNESALLSNYPPTKCVIEND